MTQEQMWDLGDTSRATAQSFTLQKVPTDQAKYLVKWFARMMEKEPVT